MMTQLTHLGRMAISPRHIPALAAAAAALLMSLAGTAWAAAVTDQVSPNGDAAVNVNSDLSRWQQEVVVGIGGQLQAIDLFYEFAQPFGQPQDFNFALYRGAGWHDDVGTALLSSRVAPIAGTMALDLSALGLMFGVGETFVFELTGLGSNRDCCAIKGNTGLYAPGQLFTWGSAFDGLDLAFTTRMATSAVPEPTSLALLALGVGLAGAASRARRV